MRINLVAVGKRMPAWVETGYQEYAKRLPVIFKLQLIEIATETRTKNADLTKLIAKEGEQMLAAISPTDHIIALDEHGTSWNTHDLAKQLQTWRDHAINISLLIGGPDGLAPSCLQKANQRWSLSALTLPHPLVRIIVAEQLYRAWSILSHHPYHR